MKLALRITTAGAIEVLDIEGEDSLTVLQTAVGGWVEAVDLATDLSMWFNEEGKLDGLPHNPYAQHFWDIAFGAHTDYTVGDVVVTGTPDDEGVTQGLTAEQDLIIRSVVRQAQEYIEPRIKITME